MSLPLKKFFQRGSLLIFFRTAWSGEKSESWDPANSTLLQVLVSIQGLVLVSQPYYTEPGYESQRETEQGRVNSKNYSEAAYVLARRFVLHALNKPVKGFEKELQSVYFDQGRFKSVIDQGSALLGMQSTGPTSTSAWGAGSKMTKGGSLALERVMKELQDFSQRLNK